MEDFSPIMKKKKHHGILKWSRFGVALKLV